MPEREHDGVVGRRRLELEVERDAEALAQRQAEAPGSRAPPNGACTTSCMPPDSSKKRSKTTSCIVGTTPSASRCAATYPASCAAPMGPRTHSAASQSRGAREPRRRRGAPRCPPAAGSPPPRAPTCAPAPRPARRAPSGGCPLRVLHAQHAAPRLDAPDAPRVRAEDEDVPRHALDGPVLVDRADRRLVRVEEHPVVGHVGDGAAVGQRATMRAALRPRSTPLTRSRCTSAPARPSAGRGALGQRSTTTSSKAARVQRGVRRRRAARARRARPRVHSLRRALGDDLLREHVERRLRRLHAVEPSRAATARTSAAHSTSSSRDVAKRRPRDVRPSAWPDRPMRWRNVVTARGEPIWQTRSTVPTSIPSSSDAVATSARISPALRRCSMRSRRSFARLPWWAPTRSSPEALAQVVRDALGHAARVDEDERRPVRAHQGGEAVVESRPTARGWRRPAGPWPAARWPDRDPAGGRRRRSSRARPAPDEEARGLARWGAPSPRGRCAAGARSASASRRASESARWLPRLSRMSAWSSSTITVRTRAQQRSRVRSAVSIR